MGMCFSFCFVVHETQYPRSAVAENSARDGNMTISFVGTTCYAKVLQISNDCQVTLAFPFFKDIFYKQVSIHGLGTPEIKKRDFELEKRFLQQLLDERLVWVEFLKQDVVRMRLDKNAKETVDRIVFNALSTVSGVSDVKEMRNYRGKQV
jgi:hypothetical protein